jgi:hypothetical protein
MREMTRSSIRNPQALALGRFVSKERLMLI